MFIAGCMFIGLGAGLLLDNAGAGVLIGLGAGLLLEALWQRRKPQG
ncbi:MAG TPA: hypothetical protein VIK99_10560 [Thermaerobacter sp.]